MDIPREDLLRLLTLAAHELRTPLSVASGYVKMLSGERLGPLNDAQHKAVAAAGRSCEQLLALASDLSAIARIERGETALTRVHVSVSTLIAEAIAHCTTNEGHPVRITADGADDAQVLVDPVRARTSLQALIAAVARSVPDGATVRVSRVLHTEKGRLMLFVVITQAGQAEAEAALDHRHFGPFDPWEGGFGIGLPLALRFLRLEGGDIQTLDTESLGIVVMIPVATGARAAS